MAEPPHGSLASFDWLGPRHGGGDIGPSLGQDAVEDREHVDLLGRQDRPELRVGASRDDFEAAVDDYLSTLASKSASALSLSKGLLYHMDAMTFETAIEAGVQLNAITRMTEDCKRGVESFLKK